MAYDFSTHFPYRFCEFDLTSNQLYSIIGLGIDPVNGSLVENNLMPPKLIQLSVYEVNGQPRYAAVLEARREKAKKIAVPIIEEYAPNFTESLQPYQAQGKSGFYNITDYFTARIGDKIWSIALPAESPLDYQMGFTPAYAADPKDFNLSNMGYFFSQINGYDPSGTDTPYSKQGPAGTIGFSFVNNMGRKQAPNIMAALDIEKMKWYLNYLTHDKGWQLTDLNGYGYLDAEQVQVARFNGVWTKQAGPPWLASLDLTRAELHTLLTELPENNYRVDQVTGYNLNGETRYALRGSAQTAAAFYFEKNYQGLPKIYWGDAPNVPVKRTQADNVNKRKIPSMELAAGTLATLYYNSSYAKSPYFHLNSCSSGPDRACSFYHQPARPVKGFKGRRRF